MRAPVTKRTRPTALLRKRAALAAKQQRSFDKAARRLVGWRRSR